MSPRTTHAQRNIRGHSNSHNTGTIQRHHGVGNKLETLILPVLRHISGRLLRGCTPCPRAFCKFVSTLIRFASIFAQIFGVAPRALDAALLATRSFDVLHARAAGAQWPKTCIAARKVYVLQTRAACTRCPKALHAALLAARSVDVLQARAAGAQWPKPCIAARKVDALQTQAACTR